MTYYLHTINNSPAFYDGYQICFAIHYGKAAPLACSLVQIRKEQRRSKYNRLRDGLPISDAKYGYCRVSVAGQEGGGG